MALTPWIPEMFAIFRKKFSSPSFLPCSRTFSRCSFMIFFSLAMGWLLISALSLRYFFFLQYPVEFSGRDISVLYCLRNDIGYAI